MKNQKIGVLSDSKETTALIARALMVKGDVEYPVEVELRQGKISIISDDLDLLLFKLKEKDIKYIVLMVRKKHYTEENGDFTYDDLSKINEIQRSGGICLKPGSKRMRLHSGSFGIKQNIDFIYVLIDNYLWLDIS